MTPLSLDEIHHTSLLQRAASPAFLGAPARVLPSQALVFLSQGRVAGVLGPGEYSLDPRALPFLGPIVRQQPTGATLGDDVFWVKMGAPVSLDVSAVLETVLDPAVGEKVTPKLEARLSVAVGDPVQMIQALGGKVDHGAVELWVKQRVNEQASELGRKFPRLAELSAESKRTEHARALGEALQATFAPLGLALVACDITAIRVPDHVASRLRLMGGTHTEYADGASKPVVAEGMRARISKDGQWYSGRVTRVSDGRAELIWDVSGARSEIALVELEPEPAYPGAFSSGTRLLAQWPDGGFYPATVRVFNGTLYEVEWADGSASWLPPGQVKMS